MVWWPVLFTIVLWRLQRVPVAASPLVAATEIIESVPSTYDLQAATGNVEILDAGSKDDRVDAEPISAIQRLHEQSAMFPATNHSYFCVFSPFSLAMVFTVVSVIVGFRLGAPGSAFVIDTDETFYAYHGTKHWTAHVSINRSELEESSKGLLGPGLYVTTELSKAQCFGTYIYVVEFSARQILVVTDRRDYQKWRPLFYRSWRDYYNGIYSARSATKRDEFCIKKQIITKVHRHGSNEAELDRLVARTQRQVKIYWPDAPLADKRLRTMQDIQPRAKRRRTA